MPHMFTPMREFTVIPSLPIQFLKRTLIHSNWKTPVLVLKMYQLWGIFLKFIAIFQVICLSVNQNQIKSTMCSYKPFLQEVTTPWEYLQPYDNILVLNSCTVNFVKNPAILIFNIQLMWQIHGSVRALAFFWGNYISKIYKSAKLRLRPLEASNAVKKNHWYAYTSVMKTKDLLETTYNRTV